MRKCNPYLAHRRMRKQALLPQIVRLKRLGLDARAIAAKLGVSKTSVYYWLQRHSQEQAALGLPDRADTIVGRSPRRYESIYLRAIRAWRRSQSDKRVRLVEETTETGAKGGAKTKKKRSVRTEPREGKSSHLTAALQALKALDRLAEARELRSAENNGRPAGEQGLTIPLSSLSVDDFHSLSDEQLDALEARFLAKYGQEEKTAATPSEQVKQEP